MLRLHRSRLSRVIAKATAAAVVLLSTPYLCPPRAVEAQAVITMAIMLDFRVAEGLDASLGRRAADAVALELTNTGDYDILARQDVEDAMQDVFGRVRHGLAKAEQLRLVKVGQLDVQRVITGEVRRRVISVNPPEAQVDLAVIQRDVASGEPINGAMVRGIAARNVGTVAPEVLVDEAINEAASKAARIMQSYILPAGNVLITSRNGQIVINRGENHGVKAGMKFAVTRNTRDIDKSEMRTEKVGEIVVDTVDPEQSTGHALITMKGIQSMDRVHAIYELPDMLRPGATTLHERGPQKIKAGIWKKVGMPILVVLGLTSLTSLGGSDRGKVTEAPRELAARPGTQATINVLTFSNPSDIADRNILAYLIYRSTSPQFIPDSNTLIDVVPATWAQYIDTADTYDVDADISVDNTTGQVDSFDIQKTPVVVPSLTRQALGHNLGASFTATTVHPGLVAGVPVYYVVVRLTISEPAVQPTTSGGGGGQQAGYELYLSSPSRVTGRTTPLAEATLVSPPNIPAAGSDTVTLGNVTFEWLAAAGANEYVVQVSDDSRFPAGRIWQSDVDEGVTIQTTAAAGTQLSRVFTTIDNFFPAPATGGTQTLFWRVGVRSTLDEVPPVQSYLFNQAPWSFQTLDAPPGPPSITRAPFRRARTSLQKPAAGARPAPTVKKDR